MKTSYRGRLSEWLFKQRSLYDVFNDYTTNTKQQFGFTPGLDPSLILAFTDLIPDVLDIAYYFILAIFSQGIRVIEAALSLLLKSAFLLVLLVVETVKALPRLLLEVVLLKWLTWVPSTLLLIINLIRLVVSSPSFLMEPAKTKPALTDLITCFNNFTESIKDLAFLLTFVKSSLSPLGDLIDTPRNIVDVPLSFLNPVFYSVVVVIDLLSCLLQIAQSLIAQPSALYMKLGGSWPDAGPKNAETQTDLKAPMTREELVSLAVQTDPVLQNDERGARQ